MNGLSPASSAAATRKVAPITAADAPSSSSRSGASTSSVPNISPTRTISHIPVAIRGSPSEASTVLIVGGDPDGGRAGVRSAHASRPTAASATPLKTISGLSATAAAPSTGPPSAPTIAAAIAEPISSPRRSRGAAPTSQPTAPAHDAAPPSPWTKRATSSTTMLFAKANASEDAISVVRPSTTVGRTPMRAVSQPPGSAPRNVPAG